MVKASVFFMGLAQVTQNKGKIGKKNKERLFKKIWRYKVSSVK